MAGVVGWPVRHAVLSRFIYITQSTSHTLTCAIATNVLRGFICVTALLIIVDVVSEQLHTSSMKV